jgi:hypothetical protein
MSEKDGPLSEDQLGLVLLHATLAARRAAGKTSRRRTAEPTPPNND